MLASQSLIGLPLSPVAKLLNVHKIPFQGWDLGIHLRVPLLRLSRSCTELPSPSGPAHPCSNAVDMEPFPTSLSKVFNWIIATTTKICTGGCSTWDHSQRLLYNPYTLLLVWAYTCPYSQVSVSGLSAIHFRGSFIRQVSCYTLLSGFRLPWPPPCCLYETTPFMVSHEPELGTLT